MIVRTRHWMVWLAVAVFSCGCGGPIKNTTRVRPEDKLIVKDATLPELLETYNMIARGVASLNATVELRPTAGSQYSGVIEEYHQVKAFLLAKRPAEIRVIGQAPVIGKTVFDMASDGKSFRVSIPSKQKFLVGPVALDRQSKKPIENLRPQHLLEALLWPEIGKNETVLFEEFNDEATRYYVLTVLKKASPAEIERKVWFNRADLRASRLQTFGVGGLLISDVRVSDWEPVLASNTAGGDARLSAFPHQIRISRPHDDYTLDLQVSKLTLNEEIPPERFKLEQPPGTELVRVGEEGEDKRP